ncbi:hypothetical protein [Polaromonas sp. YR568]|uniref:hypothetical protein n=1 Tax=Polaromonas sp. YR568 TaxID=1855301 RepID=UPI00398BD809
MQSMPSTGLWKFSPSFDTARRDRLLAISDFSQVIELVEQSATGIQLESCKGRDPELQDCVQPVFTLDVSDEAFDAFFNSAAGYRACYLQGGNLGLVANLLLIESLVDRLCDMAGYSCIAELASINIRTSLLATSAKVWVHEDDFPFQSPTTDLAVEAWIRAAASKDENVKKKASWGLCAPKGSRLQVKGALLDPLGNEVVPRKKVLRRHEIQCLGFS